MNSLPVKFFPEDEDTRRLPPAKPNMAALLWLLEKPTSAYAIFVSFALMAASILGTVMTLLEDHIIIVIKPNATGATPATAPSPAKEMAELSPSPSSGDSCPNEGQSMAIIAFLLFGCKCSFVRFFFSYLLRLDSPWFVRSKTMNRLSPCVVLFRAHDIG